MFLDANADGRTYNELQVSPHNVNFDAGQFSAGDFPEINVTLNAINTLTIDPVDPGILFAGTRPAGVYRSRDGDGSGRNWP